MKFLMSISGGRSSVMLAKLLIDTKKLQPVEKWYCTDFTDEDFFSYTVYIDPTNEDEYIFVFANTSREKEATLKFMFDVDFYWGLKVTWIEALVDFRKNKGTKYKIVNYNSAHRKGEIFEDVIKKYGIPNKMYPHCNRELKTVSIRSFLSTIGWGNWKMYKTIIGFRADEPKRNGYDKAERLNQWYPLKDWGIKKADVAYFWNRQKFDLGIIVDADGNCENCWKKSDLKLIYQAKVNPDGLTWIREMQNKYSTDKGYTFFRGKRTIDDILEEYPEILSLPLAKIIELLNDKSLLEDGASFGLIEQEGCEESCEAFGDEETE